VAIEKKKTIKGFCHSWYYKHFAKCFSWSYVDDDRIAFLTDNPIVSMSYNKDHKYYIEITVNIKEVSKGVIL